MKKNAGISTIMVTGMAGFVSVFVLVILVIIKSVAGGNGSSSQALTNAENKAKTIGDRFIANTLEADIDIFFDAKNSAIVFVGSQQIRVMWRESISGTNGKVLETVFSYDSTSLSDEEKVAEARKKTEAMKGVSGAQLSTLIQTFLMVEDKATSTAKLTLKVEYKEDGKSRFIDREYTQRWSEGVDSYKILHEK